MGSLGVSSEQTEPPNQFFSTDGPVGSRENRTMFWNASAMRGYTIEASDGELGSVSSFLFEDTSWIIRWLVVDTGKWLPGRQVLLPVSALDRPIPRCVSSR